MPMSVPKCEIGMRNGAKSKVAGCQPVKIPRQRATNTSPGADCQPVKMLKAVPKCKTGNGSIRQLLGSHGDGSKGALS